MRNQTNSEENLAPGIVPKAPWRITHVQALPGYRLAVQFVDGTAGEVDLSRLVTSDTQGSSASCAIQRSLPMSAWTMGP